MRRLLLRIDAEICVVEVRVDSARAIDDRLPKLLREGADDAAGSGMADRDEDAERRLEMICSCRRDLRWFSMLAGRHRAPTCIATSRRRRGLAGRARWAALATCLPGRTPLWDPPRFRLTRRGDAVDQI
ncbi:MAG TPA: hypothetical protein VGN80_04110 [Devosiaceae bacterium]|nr:hypothetical protein [Devosiaceae bacterium]